MSGELANTVAVCGLYCGACDLWRQTHDQDDVLKSDIETVSGGSTCDGCRSSLLSRHCLKCEMRACALAKGFGTCADCPEMPCEKVSAFDADSYTHHDGCIEQLRAMRAIGVAAWTEARLREWRCPTCGEPFSWYAKTCGKCGGPVPGLDRR